MKKFLLVCFSFVFALSALAQERVVSGKVSSSDDASVLPGVNVLIKGSATGTVTDKDGLYSVSVPPGSATLVFSFIGLQTQEVVVGDRTLIDIQLSQDVKQLSEVVVTALGIRQDRKILPYATQTVNADKLTMTRPNNVNDGLAGKVAGIQVRGQSGAALGRNADIRIRGVSSLTDGQPLYVLDGTPVSSADVNPDDLESVNVLKGPTATALYGQRASYGVVVMTSKKARKGAGLGIDVSNSIFGEKVYILPREQNSYSGGAYSDLAKFTWQAGMPTEWQAMDGKYYPDYTDDGSWGPRMVGQEYIPWYAWVPGTKYSNKTAKLTPQPNNVRKFFNTGINRITSISLGKADDNYSIRVGFTNQAQTGIQPNTNLTKNTFSTQTSVKLSNWITVGANINFVSNKVHGDINDGYANQTSGSFNQWFHRDLDMGIMQELSGLKSPGGRFVGWNHFNPTSYGTYGDAFYRGYYWADPSAYMKMVDFNDTRNRIFGDLHVTLNLTKNFKIAGFYQKNEVHGFYENKKPSVLPISVFEVESRPSQQYYWDYYATGVTFQKEDNIQFLASFDDKFFNNKLAIAANVGGNVRIDKYTEVKGNTASGLSVPDLFTLSNSKTQPFPSSNFRSDKQVRSLYASGSFGYADLLFISWSARNDWSSALPKSANSYFYPSIGGSFLFNELLGSSLPWLSLGKLRASWAQIGSDLNAYQTALLYGVGGSQWNGNIVTGTPDVLVDPKIKPSLSASSEFGMDLKFLQNKVGFGVTYYQVIRTNEIIPVTVSNSSGFSGKLINAGRIETSGIEFSLDATPIKSSDFMWNMTFNWAHNTSKVIKLAPGITSIGGIDPRTGVLGQSTFSTAQVYNVEGQKWGQLRGRATKRDASGTPVLDPSGFFIPVTNQYLGSILPDFTGGFQNGLTYKNFTLNINIDYQKGGKFFSQSDWFGTFSGLTERTARLNDLGNPERSAVADGGGVHVVGVNESGAKVDTHVDGKLYYQQFVNSNIADNSIYDLTFVKLRETNLTYRVPVDKIGLSKWFRTASVSLVGRDLWLIYAQTKDFDPSVISSNFGENGQLPGTRSMGFQIKLGF